MQSVSDIPFTGLGDPLCNYRDMAFNLRGGLSWGLSGGAFWSHDIGGFDGKPTPELYIRWAQFGLLSSHSRCHGTTPREPWEYGKKVLEIFRKYVKLRYRLIPYIYTYAHAAAETGLPVIRALPIEYQDDPNCYYYDLEYLLGRELLIAPVFSDEEKRELHLPEGEWIDYWNKISLREKQLITYKAPLDIIPMFIRMDSIIPYYTEIIDFTETEPVSLKVEFYVRNKGIFRLRDDYGSIVYKAGWEEEKFIIDISPLDRKHILKIFFIDNPAMVSVNSREIPEYDKDSKRELYWTYGDDNILTIYMSEITNKKCTIVIDLVMR